MGHESLGIGGEPNSDITLDTAFALGFLILLAVIVAIVLFRQSTRRRRDDR